MATVKDCHTLSSYYEKAFEKKYGYKPTVNRNTARWGWDGMLSGGLSMDEVKSLVDFYLDTGSTDKHSLQWLFRSYDQLIVTRQQVQDDREHREKLRHESQLRAQRWRERFGDKGITSN